MAARRRKRGRRNRGRFSALYKLLSILLIFAAIVTGCIVFFRANQIVVAGKTRYSEEQIIAAAGVEQGENLFRLNKFEMNRQIRSKLPYIDDIVISRKFPDTLVIQVTESAPVAALESGGSWWLMDARCKLLEQGDASLAQGRAVLTGLTPLSPAVGLPLAVEEEEQKKLESLTGLLSALQERGMTEYLTDFIDLSAENQVRFGYDGSLTVEMPLFDDFSGQTWRLQRALEELEAKNGTVSGTLQMPSEGNKAWLLAERWLPGTQIPAQTPAPESAPAPTPTPAVEP